MVTRSKETFFKATCLEKKAYIFLFQILIVLILMYP